MLGAADETELLHEICRIAVDEAGYRLAWVGYAEDDPERTVRPVAEVGYDAGYVASIMITWADTRLGRGPTGTAIRTGRPSVGRSFFADPELAPWRDEATRHGYASSVALPLRADDRTFGAISIYATMPDAFSPDDIELLAGLAADLAFGITTLRTRIAAEEGLRVSERNLAEAQRIAHIGSWEWDTATGAALRSAETYRIFGIEAAAVAATNAAIHASIHPEDRAKVDAAERAAIAGTAEYDVEFRILRPDGVVRIVHERGEVLRDEERASVRLVGTIEDVTDRVRSREERAQLVAAVEQAADMIWTSDAELTVTYVNRSFSRAYGYAASEIVGRHARMLQSGWHEPGFFREILAWVASGRTWSGPVVNRRKDGSQLQVVSVISGIRDASGVLVGFLQSERDITRERQLESALERDAREREMIEAAMAQIDPDDTPEEIAAAACVQIIRLPGIELAWAMGVGPNHGRILAAAGRVSIGLAAGNIVPGARALEVRARAVSGLWSEKWQARPEDGAYGQAISASGLHTAVFVPLKGPQGVIGALAFGVHDQVNAERILERLPALATFGSIVGALVAPGIATRHREDDARVSVYGILDGSAFTPFFQPIVDLHTWEVVGYEALCRFDNGIPPDIVFRMAVLAGLGIELEVATMRAALEAAVILPAGAYLSLNASPELIGSGELPALLGACQRALVLEVTEHVLVDDYTALRERLSAIGVKVRLAVDDAGAGYASLRHILELAPDFVKLDIGLIRGIDADPARQALLAGMGYFAVKRKLRLIAEGIETTAELKALQALAIGYGQGYLLGRPADGRGPGPWPSKIDLPASRP